MPLGIDTAEGVLEKFLPGVSFPVLMNTVLPGALFAGICYPFAPAGWKHSLSLEIDKTWQELVIVAFVVLCAGALISVLNAELYKLYEGRAGWPVFLFNWGVARQQHTVHKLSDKAVKAKASKDIQRYDEIWYRLRKFPIKEDSGKRYAKYPTLIGNILAEYEDYPKTRYGMDSIFYWPRLWLLVDKDQKAEIGNSWATADGLLSLSAVSIFGGVGWLIGFIGAQFGVWSWRWAALGQSYVRSLAACAGWLLLGYGLYRISLSFHRQNGDIFKALFDLYREKLKKLTSLEPHEQDLWEAAWAYLQYLKIPCPVCETGYISVATKSCGNPECQGHAEEIVEQFRRTGELVILNDNQPARQETPRSLQPLK